MCGRYYLTSPPSEVAELFGVGVRDNFPPRYNIAPTQPIAIIRQNPLTFEPDPEYALVRWGFIPSWSKDGHVDSKPLVNARSETADEKATFKSAWRRRRCLIPANGFYEWTIEKGAKQPYAIYPKEDEAHPLFAFAGLWEHWMGADGSEMESAAILTRAAGDDLGALYKREPITVPPEKYSDWLHADERDKHQYAPVLDTPVWWGFHKVAPKVGNVRTDCPTLLTPYLDAQQQLF